jgi:hypothetical protein
MGEAISIDRSSNLIKRSINQPIKSINQPTKSINPPSIDHPIQSTHSPSIIKPINQSTTHNPNHPPTQGGAEDKTNYLMAAASYAGRVFVFIIVVFKMAYVGVKVRFVCRFVWFLCVCCVGVCVGVYVYGCGCRLCGCDA